MKIKFCTYQNFYYICKCKGNKTSLTIKTTLIMEKKKMEENIKEILGCGHFMHADKEDFIPDETDDDW